MTTTNYTKEEQNQISETIYHQLGGRRFAVMTGAKDFVYGETNGNPFLSFHIGGNAKKIKALRIELNQMDTYTLTFYKNVRILDEVMTAIYGTKKYKTEIVECEKLENVYCDQLRDIFTSRTELYTSL